MTTMPTVPTVPTPQQHSQPRQQQMMLLVVRSFLRHSLSAVCRSRLEEAACACARGSAGPAATEVDGGDDDDAMPALLDRCFRPAAFGDVPNPLLVSAAAAAAGAGAGGGSPRSGGGCDDAIADDANDTNDAGEDPLAAISSKLCGWLEGGTPSCHHHHHQQQQQRGGILDQLLLPAKMGRSNSSNAKDDDDDDDDDDSTGGADGNGGGGASGGNGKEVGAAATAATLVVATWIRGTGDDNANDDEDGDERDNGKDNGEDGDGDDSQDDGDTSIEENEEHRPADGVVLERFRFSLRPTPPSSSSSASASASSSSSSANYFAQLRSTLRSLQDYCHGEDSKSVVDPAEDVDYEAVGRAFTVVMEQEEEMMVVEGDDDDDDDDDEVEMEVGGDENACGPFTKRSRCNPLDDHDARTMLRRRWASTHDIDGGRAGTTAGSINSSNDEEDEDDGPGSSTPMTDGAICAGTGRTADCCSQNRAGMGTDASHLMEGATMMMAQQSQSQSQSSSQTGHWRERTERTADGANDPTGRGAQSQMVQSQLSKADEVQHTHSMSQYSEDDDESSDDDDDDGDDDDNDGVDRYHLGCIDLGDRQLFVSVERSIYDPDSPVVRLLFGGDDDDGDEFDMEEEESATSPSQSQRQYGDDDMFSVTTTLPSQGAMGYSSYRHVQPMMNAHPSQDANLGELEEGVDDASNGSMVTPPPPMSTVQVRTNNNAQTDLNGSMESTQPSQSTGCSTQQSTITEGASQRSRRRKGSKKKQSARARANADVSKIMGVRRRDCIPRTRKGKSPPALTPMPPAGNAARSTGKRPALASALRNGDGCGGGKRPALSNAANRRSTRFSPLPKVGNGGGNTPMRRGVGPSSRSPAISSISTVLLGSAANNTPVPADGASGRSPAISGTSTATILMSRYGSVSEAETVLMSRTPTPPRRDTGRQG